MCGTRHSCLLYTLFIAVRNLTAQSSAWPGERVQCNSALQQCAATYASACETPSPRRNTAALLRAYANEGHAVITKKERCRKRCMRTSAPAAPRAGSRRRAPARLPPGRAGPTSSPGSRQSRSSSGSVWKSTSASGAPDDSSLTHFSAMTRPCWLRRAVKNWHIATPSRHGVDGVEVESTIQHERAVKF